MTCKELCILIVNKPNFYSWIVNVPSAIDASEYLFDNHWDELNAKTIKNIERILISSRLYVKNDAI